MNNMLSAISSVEQQFPFLQISQKEWGEWQLKKDFIS